MVKTRRPPCIVSLTALPASTLASIASTMFSIAVIIEAGSKRVETGIGKPVVAGINSIMLFVPRRTASYTNGSDKDVCMTGTA